MVPAITGNPPLAREPNMKVVVGGGSGFVGRGIRKAFERKGHEVIDISRSRRPKSITWNDVQKNGLPTKCDVVINVAGENELNPARRWSAAYAQELVRSRVESTKLLAKCIAADPVRSWISCSATSAYPLSEGGREEYTEYSEVPPQDNHLYQLVKQWEEAAALPADCPTHHAIVRVSLVLGPWGGMVDALWNQMYFHLGGTLGSGRQMASWIHLEDLGELFLFAAEKQVSGVLNGSTPTPVSMETLIQAFAGAMGRRAFLWAPSFLVRIIFDGPRSAILLKGNRVIPQRALDLGFQFKYSDIHTAFGDIVKARQSK